MKQAAAGQQRKKLFRQLFPGNIFQENQKIIFQGILGILFLALAFFFFKHEKTELSTVKHSLENASAIGVTAGVLLTGFFIFIQGVMYVYSFRCIGARISYSSSMLLFIKRNFISIFLPAGGISSLAFFTKNIERQHISKSKIHVASTIYAFVGILSVVLVALPALAYSLLEHSVSSKEVVTLAGLIMFLVICYLAAKSLFAQGRLYRLLVRIYPAFEAQYAELKAMDFDRGHFVRTTLISILIEFVGIGHLLISMKALGLPLSFEGAVIGYIVSVMFLLVSPFLRGLGAIELSLSFILTRYGFSPIEAVSVTFLYRFFEFWLLLLIGAFSFIFVKNNIVLRIAPVVLTFSLGIVNIISTLTPAIHYRLKLLHNFLPWYAISLSNYAVLTIGIFLLLLSAFLLKGVRTAWYLALSLAIISIIGHLTKAIDYEEAILAAFTVIALLLTRRQYFVRHNPRLANIGIQVALISIAAVLIYGIIVFYFLKHKHFNIDFTLWESVKYTIQNFFFWQSDSLHATDQFARRFLYSLNLSGGLTMGFLLYSIVRPFVFIDKAEETDRQLARELVQHHGNSALDYFKTYYDKNIFFSQDREAFIAYRISGNYAVVLENPIARDEKKMEQIIRQFDEFCAGNGIKSLFYRVPEKSLPLYLNLHKKNLFIGQEAILDLSSFTIEGKEKKSIRTSSNKQKQLGYRIHVYHPPVKEGIIQKIYSVSNEWKQERNYQEIVFSQGLFDPQELRQQTIITVENDEEKILAFANLIPDYASGEATYDLIRNAGNTPNGLIEFLMAELFFYLKEQGFKTVNLGFAALAGIDERKNLAEKSIRFAYDKIKSLSHYKGLKIFKDKFGPQWQNKYLIYSNDYDLFSVPRVLRKVIKP